MAGFTVTVRRQGVTERFKRDDLGAAIDLLEFELRALTQTERRQAARGLAREYSPEDLVAVRGELSGKRIRAGVDVRGDGSAAAFTGRVRRTPVESQGRETPYDALRRVLTWP